MPSFSTLSMDLYVSQGNWIIDLFLHCFICLLTYSECRDIVLSQRQSFITQSVFCVIKFSLIKLTSELIYDYIMLVLLSLYITFTFLYILLLSSLICEYFRFCTHLRISTWYFKLFK